jgi:acetyl esterase/lipase
MATSITRRVLLCCGSSLAANALLHRWCRGNSDESDKVRPETHTYKTVDNLAIKADVYRAQGKQSRPVVVWIHGGALIGGHRGDVPRRVKDYAAKAGHVLMSIDYRLAPETQLPAIIEDLEEAFRWVRREGPRQFNVDPDRVAVIGGSAGGYLTLTSGFRVDPPPTVLFSLFGYGDLIGDWYSKPSPHPRHHGSKLTREEAYRQVSGSPISDARDRKGDGGAFYQYCRQTGTWPLAVSGWDPTKEADRFDAYMPVKNVTHEYPPTVMIHGTADTDVPHEQSVMMAEQFKRHDVPHLMISIEGGEHGFGGGDPKKIEEAYAKAFAFVDERLRR